ncbi:MAG: hypothetical protein ACOX4U_07990 [Anaerovoracaceae bacterium]|jgi:stage III sporulation protein AB
MMKLLLSVLIICTGIGAGYLRSKTFSNRVIHLKDLSMAIQVLENEMTYTGDPLATLLNRIGQRTDNMAGVFFLNVCSRLQSIYIYDFSTAWNHGVHEVYGDTSLTRDDLKALAEIGGELGHTDISGQESLLFRARESLDAREKEAAEDNRTKGWLYQRVYSAIGILLVIILI